MTLTNHVRLTLGEQEFELKPSLKAAQNVSSRFNGFVNALQATAAGDLGAISYIVRQGVPLRVISTDDLNERVYEAGTRNIMGEVIRFVQRLSNGGKDPDADDGDDENGAEDNRGNGEV